MKLILTSIYDVKAQSYGTIAQYENKLVALREFSQLIRNQKDDSMIKNYPDDYEFHVIGEWDNHTGEISSKIEKIGVASEYINNKKED